MKRIVRFLLGLVIVLPLSAAREYHDKLFFKSQPLRVINGVGQFIRARDYVSSDDTASLSNQDSLISITGLYRLSRNEEKIARYFLPQGSLSVGPDDTKYDYNVLDLISYDSDTEDPPAMNGTIKLAPQEKIYGVRISARKTMGLFYVEGDLSCARAEHFLGLGLEDGSDDPVTGDTALSYFQGTVSKTTQAALTGGVLKDPVPGAEYECVEGTLRVGVDYDLEQGSRCGFFGGVHFPVGVPKYKDALFQPIIGNLDHFGLTGGVRMLAILRHGSSHSIGAWGRVQADYFFKDDRERLPGLAIKTTLGDARRTWGVLAPAKRAGELVYTPIANRFSAYDVTVRPGQEVSCSAGLFIDGAHASFDTGYRLWLRGDEDIAGDTWTDSATYTFLRQTTAYKVEPDFDVCRVPAVVTHTLHAGLTLSTPQFPGYLSAGCAYEWVEGNAALENIMAWGSFNFAF